MKSLKNRENIFSDILDEALRSMTISGSHPFIVEMFNIETLYETADREAIMWSLDYALRFSKEMLSDSDIPKQERRIWENVAKIASEAA